MMSLLKRIRCAADDTLLVRYGTPTRIIVRISVTRTKCVPPSRYEGGGLAARLASAVPKTKQDVKTLRTVLLPSEWATAPGHDFEIPQYTFTADTMSTTIYFTRTWNHRIKDVVLTMNHRHPARPGRSRWKIIYFTRSLFFLYNTRTRVQSWRL
jgi:hypothetical protein